MRLIDADELKKKLYTARELWSHGKHPRVVEEDDIDEMPTVDLVKHGYWLRKFTWFYWKCPFCEWKQDFPSHYCPLCGAKLDEVTE